MTSAGGDGGLTRVKNVFWKKGMYEKKNKKPSEASIAGGIHQFRLGELGPKGFEVKMESRLVRVARRLPNCMPTSVKK